MWRNISLLRWWLLCLEDVKCAFLLSLLRLLFCEKCITSSPRVLVPIWHLIFCLLFLSVSKRPVRSALEELILERVLHKVICKRIRTGFLLYYVCFRLMNVWRSGIWSGLRIFLLDGLGDGLLLLWSFWHLWLQLDLALSFDALRKF